MSTSSTESLIPIFRGTRGGASNPIVDGYFAGVKVSLTMDTPVGLYTVFVRRGMGGRKKDSGISLVEPRGREPSRAAIVMRKLGRLLGWD